MKDFPMVLNDYRLRSDFAFGHAGVTDPCNNCLSNGEVTLRIYPSSLKGSSTPGTDVRRRFTRRDSRWWVRRSRRTRERELLRKESQQIGNKVKEASSIGDGKAFIGTRALNRSKKKNGVGNGLKNKKILQHWRSKLQNLFAATRKAELLTDDEINDQLLFHSR